MAGPFDVTPAQWDLLRRLLDEALALDAPHRGAWLDTLGGLGADHAALLPRLRALLAQADDAAGLARLDTLPKIETGDFAPRPPAAMPAQVGPYRLLREIGRGGMAGVWLAERGDWLPSRRVALKLPHAAWQPAGFAERLQREREILATLEHPHIARLYDAGVADDGQPWLALEYVEGERIDRWCAANRPALPAQLRLFLQAARAVAYAHSRLIVHRDLKPANLLVGADGRLRLLDFGIAKLLAPGDAADSELTRHEGRPLTPAYASPEQLRGETLGTASDIYSLGVVLYELLAGVRPPAALPGAPAPRRPSEAAADAGLARRLRGDLDTIVLKALKPLPAERYATADALAEDIERHLDGRPVRARPDTLGYRLKKAVARHRVAAAAGAVALAALLGGGTLALWQAREALAQAQRADEVKRFIASVFEEASPWAGPQNRPSAAELLQRARLRIDGRFAAQPLIRLELLNVVAASLVGLQETAAALPVLADAVALAASTVPGDHPQALRPRLLQLDAHLAAGRIAELKAALQDLLPLLERDPARHAEALATALLRQAQVANHEGRYAEMESLGRRADAVVRRHLPAGHALQMRSLLVMANALENQGDGSRSRDLAARALQAAETLYAAQPLHPELAELRFVHARVLHQAGESAAALPEFERAIADTAAVFGADSLRVATMQRTRVAPLLALNRLAEALQASERALQIMQAHYAPDAVPLAYALVARGSIRMALRQPQSAFDDHDRALRILGAALAPDSSYLLHVRALRAGALAHLGRSGEALAELAEVVPRHLAQGPPGLYVGALSWAVALRLHGRPAQALALLRAHEALAARPRERWRWALERGLNLLALGRVDEAAQALQQAPPVADGLPATPERIDALLAHGRLLLAQGRAAEALPLLQQADRFWQAHDRTSRWAAEAASWLARCRAALKAQP